MSTKGCPGFVLFCLDLELFPKIKKPGFYTLILYIFINNLRSKQNKKNPEHPFLTLLSRKRVQDFTKKY